MASAPNEDNGLSEAEIAKRRDDAIRRALNTPKPKQNKADKAKASPRKEGLGKPKT